MNEKDFWAKVNKTESCWLWTGVVEGGYGRVHLMDGSGRRIQLAHRAAYWLSGRDLPSWPMVLDHLCENKGCVNPDHLAVVSTVHNTMRSGRSVGAVNARKTHCPSGHEYTPENTKYTPSNPGSRYCRTCHRLDNIARKRRKAQEKRNEAH